jgi:hypothetical protein
MTKKGSVVRPLQKLDEPVRYRCVRCASEIANFDEAFEHVRPFRVGATRTTFYHQQCLPPLLFHRLFIRLAGPLPARRRPSSVSLSNEHADAGAARRR